MSEPLLTVEELCVCLGEERHVAVEDLSLELRAEERVALLGPSGCGKTTTLRAIAGFEPVRGGRISFEGRVQSDAGGVRVPAHRRGLGYVFQEFALFPHLSVEENVGFGLRKQSRADATKRIAEMLRLTGLEGLEARRPFELSGGQQQRVALARALAPSPRLLLLDEPFSSLDPNLRGTTRRHTERVLTSVGATALLVTHDRDEAMSFADRLIVMRAGRAEQAGTPEELYAAPRSAFVAEFLGAANFVEGEATGQSARTALGEVPLRVPASGTVSLCLRPESLELVVEGGAPARVVEREYHGASCIYGVEGEGFQVAVLAVGDAPFRKGDAVGVRVRAPAVVLEG